MPENEKDTKTRLDLLEKLVLVLEERCGGFLDLTSRVNELESVNSQCKALDKKTMMAVIGRLDETEKDIARLNFDQKQIYRDMDNLVEKARNLVEKARNFKPATAHLADDEINKLERSFKDTVHVNNELAALIIHFKKIVLDWKDTKIGDSEALNMLLELSFPGSLYLAQK